MISRDAKLLYWFAEEIIYEVRNVHKMLVEKSLGTRRRDKTDQTRSTHIWGEKHLGDMNLLKI